MFSPNSNLQGKRVAMVSFSGYPEDPRPRRAATALLEEGMSVDFICLADDKSPKREVLGELRLRRLAIEHRRGGALSYAYQYSAFILASTVIFALRSLKRRYDLVYINNMPDILVVSALFPKLLGAKVILDQHDPMPELMTTIFNLPAASLRVRLIRILEKWSVARADAVITVNIACKRLFASRSCAPEKIVVVMNSPDGEMFPFRAVEPARERGGGQPFIIMYHGSLVERNGLGLAVEALALVRRKVPSVELRIYGKKTGFLEQVLQRARAMGLEDCVSFFGPKRLEDLSRTIAECHLGVIPNQRNAFTDINTPTRMFEYLSAGKPVIAPRTPGIQDYFDARSLIFFESGDAEDLAQKMVLSVQNYDQAIATARRGQEVYLAHQWPEERQTLVNLAGRLLA